VIFYSTVAAVASPHAGEPAGGTLGEVGMELADKVMIVTGAAGNLGSSCAREAARQGAKVVAVDLPNSALDRIIGEIRDAGGEAVAHRGDVSEEQDVIAIVETARREYGGIDALANVAAAMSEIEKDWNLETIDIASWDRAMAVNLRGSMLCAKYAIPSMLARGGGAIVNFGSTAGIRGDEGLFAYSTSKAGLLGFTLALAASYGKRGIRCNAVSPGSVWTDATKAGLGDKLDLMARTRSTARLGIPEDIGHTVVFLCSDKAAYITGQNIVVDGGGTSHQPWVGMT
jgi:NAD(P)-dependent dehydrogenase (short-subunit alcohol dehydrogenase family)